MRGKAPAAIVSAKHLPIKHQLGFLKELITGALREEFVELQRLWHRPAREAAADAEKLQESLIICKPDMEASLWQNKRKGSHDNGWRCRKMLMYARWGL